jgi:hypothetical protein
MYNTTNPPSPGPGTKPGMVFTVGSKMVLLLLVGVGLLLLLIGVAKGNQNVFHAGTFIFPAGLIWGGLFLEEKLAVRVTLLAIGGIFIICSFAMFSSLISMVSSMSGMSNWP